MYRVANRFRRQLTEIRNDTWKGYFRNGFWVDVSNVLRDPSHSKISVIINCFLVVCIVLSTASFCVETIPKFERDPAWSRLFWHLEVFFVTVFTIELGLRLAIHYERWDRFWSNFFIACDILALLPFYMELGELFFGKMEEPMDFRIIRVFRILRVLKLSRYSPDLNLLFQGIAKARVAFLLLFTMITLTTIWFSFLVFLAENHYSYFDEKLDCYVRGNPEQSGFVVENHYTGCSPFQNVPISFYWAITCLTTVGYGDTFPLTNIGRIICGFCMVVGLMCVALPTTHLGVEFAVCYEESKALEKLNEGKRELMEKSKDELTVYDCLTRLNRIRQKLDTDLYDLKLLQEEYVHCEELSLHGRQWDEARPTYGSQNVTSFTLSLGHKRCLNSIENYIIFVQNSSAEFADYRRHVGQLPTLKKMTWTGRQSFERGGGGTDGAGSGNSGRSEKV